MIFDVQKNSFLHYYDNGVGILDWVFSNLTNAGWVLDKIVSDTPIKEYGQRAGYPMISHPAGEPFMNQNDHTVTPWCPEMYASYFKQDGTYTADLYKILGNHNTNYNLLCKLRNASFTNNSINTSWLASSNYAATLSTSANANAGAVLSQYSTSITKSLLDTHGAWIGCKYVGNAGSTSPMGPPTPVYYNSSGYNTIGVYTSELYIHSTNSNGDVIYVSFYYNFSTSTLYLYNNLGFDTNLGVDRQPGTIQSIDSTFYSYAYLKVTPGFWKMHPTEYVFVGDINGFFISVSNNYLTSSILRNYISVQSLNKLFPYNGGIVRHSTNYERGSFYVLYEGEWYGPDIAVSVTNKQGYANMLTPVSYSSAVYNNFSWELYLTSKLWGINETGTLDAEKKPIGTEMNCFMHYGGTPTTNTKIKVAGNWYASIALDTSNRLALKL